VNLVNSLKVGEVYKILDWTHEQGLYKQTMVTIEGFNNVRFGAPANLKKLIMEHGEKSGIKTPFSVIYTGSNIFTPSGSTSPVVYAEFTYFVGF
jgi:hypothetical protein